MSKISEEEDHFDVISPLKLRTYGCNTQKTTNDHIQEFKYNQKRSLTSQVYNLNGSTVYNMIPV